MKIGWTLWFTGLHGAGKSTIAERIVKILRKNRVPVILLDGDELRKTVSFNLEYSLADRNEHMRRVANICKIISENGVLSVASVASPTEESRAYARKILKKMFLVYVKCPLEVCEKRDVKGHYKKAKEKERGFEEFMHISANFEEPRNPNIILNTEVESVEKSVKKLLDAMIKNDIVKLSLK